jgi:hypothetical protein
VRDKLVFSLSRIRDRAEWATYRMSADADAGAGRGKVGGWVVLIGWMVQDGGRAGKGVIGLCGTEAGNA